MSLSNDRRDVKFVVRVVVQNKGCMWNAAARREHLDNPQYVKQGA